MKKNYTTPEVNIVMIETQQIIAASPTYGVTNVSMGTTEVDNDNALGREDDMSFDWSSGSLFDDEEE
ncbi:MAG: hypothetical protein IJ549_05335 [Prevotella sp.]|nr:hypothetical protein [Prevotella sp.]